MFEPITWVMPDKSVSHIEVDVVDIPGEEIEIDTGYHIHAGELVRFRGKTYLVYDVTGGHGLFTIRCRQNGRAK